MNSEGKIIAPKPIRRTINFPIFKYSKSIGYPSKEKIESFSKNKISEFIVKNPEKPSNSTLKNNNPELSLNKELHKNKIISYEEFENELNSDLFKQCVSSEILSILSNKNNSKYIKLDNFSKNIINKNKNCFFNEDVNYKINTNNLTEEKIFRNHSKKYKLFTNKTENKKSDSKNWVQENLYIGKNEKEKLNVKLGFNISKLYKNEILSNQECINLSNILDSRNFEIESDSKSKNESELNTEINIKKKINFTLNLLKNQKRQIIPFQKNSELKSNENLNHDIKNLENNHEQLIFNDKKELELSSIQSDNFYNNNLNNNIMNNFFNIDFNFFENNDENFFFESDEIDNLESSRRTSYLENFESTNMTTNINFFFFNNHNNYVLKKHRNSPLTPIPIRCSNPFEKSLNLEGSNKISKFFNDDFEKNTKDFDFDYLKKFNSDPNLVEKLIFNPKSNTQFKKMENVI